MCIGWVDHRRNYYLELRKLLKDKLDADITHQDYIDLVKRVQIGFLKGVQTNIRMRIAAEWITNFKMISPIHFQIKILMSSK